MPPCMLSKVAWIRALKERGKITHSAIRRRKTPKSMRGLPILCLRLERAEEETEEIVQMAETNGWVLEETIHWPDDGSISLLFSKRK